LRTRPLKQSVAAGKEHVLYLVDQRRAVDTDISFGLGLSYNFTRNLGVRAEWERFKLDDADADPLSIGIVWRF
jgi:opacity protein-like surface antigen